MSNKNIKIPGRLESAEMGGVVTGADAILDDTKGKKQNVINAETDAELVRLDETKQVNLTFDQTPTENSTNPVTSGGVYDADQLLSQAIEAILLLIPSAASALNKLVDLNTMNSSISTATASFKGTYNLVSDLHLTVSATHAQIAAALDAMSLGADNNDYAFVQVPNTDLAPTDIKKTERYKFNGTNWAYEYDLNNSGFTSAQWAAINSNITTVLVSKLSALPTNEALTALLAAKQDNLTFDDDPTPDSNNPVKSGGIYTRNNEIIAMITALDAAKQNVLTFDTTPTENSTNPVTSNGIYQAIYLVQAALAALDGRMLSAEHSIELLTEDVGVLRTLYQALSLSDIIVGAKPATGVANTVYRVPGTSTYADWMYYNGAWVKLAEYTTLDGYLYKGIATPSSSPASSAVKMFYFALTAGTYTNFGNLVVTDGISILKYDGANWTQDKISYMDGGVFDVTAYSGREFASLSALLSDANLNNLIPTAVRKGGMSIKFVESSDNKYVQFRYMSTSTAAADFTNEANWQEDVLGTINISMMFPIGGTDGTNIYTPENARKAVPKCYRKLGVSIQYLINDSVWCFEYFANDRYGWSYADEYWKKVLPEINQATSEVDAPISKYIMTGKRFRADTGALEDNASSDAVFFPVVPNTNYTITGEIKASRVTFFPTAPNANQLSNIITGNISSFQTPNGCKYVGLTFDTHNVSDYVNTYVINDVSLRHKNTNAIGVINDKINGSEENSLKETLPFSHFIQLSKRYRADTGILEDNSGTDCVYVQVTPNTVYNIIGAAAYRISYFSGLPQFPEETYISQRTGTSITQFTTPNDCKYVGVGFNTLGSASAYSNVFIKSADNLTYKKSFGSFMPTDSSDAISNYIQLEHRYRFDTGILESNDTLDCLAVKVNPKTQYTIHGAVAQRVCFYSEMAGTGYLSVYTIEGETSSFSVPEGCYYVGINFLHQSNVSAYDNAYIVNRGYAVDELNETVCVEDKPLTTIAFVGSSTTANLIGGNVPNIEPETRRPMRLLTNNFPRRFYDELSWNKPEWRRLDDADWTISGFEVFGSSDYDEIGLSGEKYYKSETSGAYVEITIPKKFKNFALICRSKSGYGKLNITINGSAPSTYVNPYWQPKAATNTVVNESVVPHYLNIAPSQVDLDEGTTLIGNPYKIIQFINLPTSNDNVIRIAKDDALRCDIWGGFFWNGNTLVCMNLGIGGYTTSTGTHIGPYGTNTHKGIIQEILPDQILPIDWDYIILQIPITNNTANGYTLQETETDLNTITTLLAGRDVMYTTQGIIGLSIEYDVNFFTNYSESGGYPSNTESQSEKAVETVRNAGGLIADVFTYMKKKVISRGGTLLGGEAGLWYCYDGMHSNAAGCEAFFKCIFTVWLNRSNE